MLYISLIIEVCEEKLSVSLYDFERQRVMIFCLNILCVCNNANDYSVNFLLFVIRNINFADVSVCVSQSVSVGVLRTGRDTEVASGRAEEGRIGHSD